MFSSIHIYAYVIPLVAVISVVYSATRFESTRAILLHSLRLFGTILGVLALASVVLLIVNRPT